MKNEFEPVTDAIKNTSDDLTKTMMLTSIETNKALSNLNDKLLEKLNDTGILAIFCCLLYLESLTQNILVIIKY